MNILHQIYFDLGKGKTLRKISDFALCYDKTEVFCKNNNIQHKLWTEKDVEDLLIDYPEYLDLYESFRYPIQKIDFARILILYRYGGMYSDLDIFPFPNDNIDHLFEKEFWISCWWENPKPYNALLGSKANNPLLKEIITHMKESVESKSKMKIYDTWTARYVFQTTGHHCIHRVLKRNKLDKNYLPIVSVWNNLKEISVCVPDNKALFMDYSSSVWYEK